jgi:Stress responsive A/B Barrel Domain
MLDNMDSERFFRHIVFFKLNDGATAAKIAEIQAGLTACAMALPGTLNYTCGPDVTLGGERPDKRWDFSLVADFVSQEAWLAYDKDAEHNRLRADVIAAVLTDRAVAQYWVE